MSPFLAGPRGRRETGVVSLLTKKRKKKKHSYEHSFNPKDGVA
jgi:hypothetical protein